MAKTMIVNYQCWSLVSIGIDFRCCSECHESGETHVIVLPDGRRVQVCCGALSAYNDSDNCSDAGMLDDASKNAII